MNITLTEALNEVAAGDVEMTYELGVAFLLGTQGVPRDNLRALELLRAAAGNGHAAAFNSMGVLYCGELRGPKDLTTAWACFNAAAGLGDEQGGRNRAEVEKIMNADDLRTARVHSGIWLSELAKARMAGKLPGARKKAASG